MRGAFYVALVCVAFAGLETRETEGKRKRETSQQSNKQTVGPTNIEVRLPGIRTKRQHLNV